MQFFIFILFYFLRYSFFRQAADNVKDSETETNGIGTNMTNNFTETTMNETNKMEENLTMSCPDMGLCYEIEFTWDSEPITHTPIQVTLQSADQGLNVSVNATFFDDPPPPNSTEGQSYNGLWDYEGKYISLYCDWHSYLMPHILTKCSLINSILQASILFSYQWITK